MYRSGEVIISFGRAPAGAPAGELGSYLNQRGSGRSARRGLLRLLRAVASAEFQRRTFLEVVATSWPQRIIRADVLLPRRPRARSASRSAGHCGHGVVRVGRAPRYAACSCAFVLLLPDTCNARPAPPAALSRLGGHGDLGLGSPTRSPSACQLVQGRRTSAEAPLARPDLSHPGCSLQYYLHAS